MQLPSDNNQSLTALRLIPAETLYQLLQQQTDSTTTHSQYNHKSEHDDQRDNQYAISESIK